MRHRVLSFSLMLIDAFVVAAVPFIALYLRFEGVVDPYYYKLFIDSLPEIIVVRLVTFYFFGLYHRLWRYASISELLGIIGAVTASSIIISVFMYAIGVDLPRSLAVINWLLVIVFVGASRMFIRVLSFMRQRQNEQTTRTLIVGAGDAGAMIAREICQRYYDTKKLVGFIDDDDYKQSKMLFQAKVLGKSQDIRQVAEEYKVDEIIVAIPSLAGSQLREIVQVCKKTGCTVKVVPGIYELIDGKVTVQQLRNVDLEDLLRRDPVKLDLEQIAGYLKGKRVLVTGAGGSIGSELCRQIAKRSPQMLVLLGKGENSIYEIDRELREKYNNFAIEPVIADVRDEKRINNVFARFKPQVVFHAAAHKHVPLMEAQPEEAVRNNIFGTRNVAQAADKIGAETFIMISTDKAVNPTSVMGATKRVAELIVQTMNVVSKTKFAAVRFGNVLGSRGSVVPLFRRQIAMGGPVTITHPDMKRYFMTIPEASQLVLQAGSMASGGEVFVLDMGEPVKIVDMASDLIELSGLKPGRDIEIKFTGLRPGEKLFEELLTAEEGTASTKHEKIFVANLKRVDERQLARALQSLQSVMDPEQVIYWLAKLIPTYHSSQLKYYGIDTNELKLDAKTQSAHQSMPGEAQYQPVSDLGA
ncbi:MAG TPA: nucleoside-diphosphate sugar epimerase/dehydratase [Methylomusa anaerophila]|uniref:UDP-N-acetyl-alpha-D-glucosamine C6 dehydratase n=1 Tax=Methylomusa anaerophila TaxID=1930071 RepID=A0A348AGD2_9FIRM|nr:nucleoside-diphosphate sugar epimerase/dehydratase [Methylomusa anaerophila]BBB90130.1 UDP-N-acetyl-alpha-D-glucosamine C6 dehydratase [Methylomusa anaerophila]HML88146.1 nucleoside-diphosphate sugar epimerase/dehydratase [Methylomusa anaerophila]